MPANNTEIEKRLWDAADELRANSKLKSSEYSVPVLGLIFLRYADHKFGLAEQELAQARRASARRQVGRIDYQARGVLYLPDGARFSQLLQLPEGADIGQAINDAMAAIERENDELAGVLPRSYNRLENSLLISLLKNLNSISLESAEGDVFGKIYEYFLGKFAMSEGQKGGEFFTPLALVKLIVEVIEPYQGRIFDPACGSGGMFVQSAAFVERHKRNPSAEISVYGQEKTAETVRLCKMNLAVHGLSGDIREGNSYYDDIHASPGKFDFVMANPPFNVDRVDRERIKDDRARFPLGMPRADNANYLWIQLFYSALNERGRAGFVMANSAGDARASEQDIRKQLIQAGVVDVLIAIGSNFFYTVTLPCTLWFLDKGKLRQPLTQALTPNPSPPGRGAQWRDTVLFVDARHIYRQVDRAHREFTTEQINFLATLVRLYRGEELNGYTFAPDGLGLTASQISGLQSLISNRRYGDIAGLCKVATIQEIEAQGWSLNPGRYVGVAEQAADDFDFKERLEELNEELEMLNAEAHDLEARISENVSGLLEAS
ncbi:MAG: type I restriction-modification system subunit M [Chloroflexi bacterium]|nr:type I restriction-modification system subunit M [Chloroflexota bacterium]